MQDLAPFAAFSQNFCSESFNILNTYQEAVFLSLQVRVTRLCPGSFLKSDSLIRCLSSPSSGGGSAL